MRFSFPAVLLAVCLSLFVSCSKEDGSSADDKGLSQKSEADPAITTLTDSTNVSEDFLTILDDKIYLEDDLVPVEDGEPSEDEIALTNSFGVAPEAAAPKVLYLNHNGGTYHPGRVNNPATNVSTVVQNRHGRTLTIQPFDGTAAQWQDVVRRVRVLFSRYNVSIVEQEPTSGDYVECVVTGNSGSVFRDYTKYTVGVSPSSKTCKTLSRPINFIMPKLGGNGLGVARVSEVIAHEIAHTIGLQHTFPKGDVMSYQNDIPKTFLDQNMKCGKKINYIWTSINCKCGSVTQNSHQRMLARLGPAVTQPTPPPPAPSDPNPPVVQVVTPTDGATLPARQEITITADVKDNNLESVALWWEFTRTTMTCPPVTPPRTWACSHSGSTYSWKLTPGTGIRSFRVRAKDKSGNITESPTYSINLTPGGVEPTCTSPRITITSPAQNARLKRGQSFTISARIISPDQQLSKVEMIWSGQGFETYSYPIEQVGTSEIWRQKTSMANTAKPGKRELVIRAVANSGISVSTAPVTINVIE